ncbi:MAG: hypothetical protein JWM80_6692 [Cyanobacteria bacterium RYN_339]|nr:hypothetical protein [Cyanobacteria bacterium RYN_339]
MPLNPKRAFNALLEGSIRPNEDGFWALYDGDEELTYWDEGLEMEVKPGDTWLKGVVAWDGDGYVLDLKDGGRQPLQAGMLARRRVGGSV